MNGTGGPRSADMHWEAIEAPKIAGTCKAKTFRETVIQAKMKTNTKAGRPHTAGTHRSQHGYHTQTEAFTVSKLLGVFPLLLSQRHQLSPGSFRRPYARDIYLRKIKGLFTGGDKLHSHSPAQFISLNLSMKNECGKTKTVMKSPNHIAWPILGAKLGCTRGE